MPPERRKISLIYYVIFTLLLVGLVPLVLTGWLLSRKSGSELRAAENRYQIQLVQEKARQIEMFGKRFIDRHWQVVFTEHLPQRRHPLRE